jgi:hypothetical protein
MAGMFGPWDMTDKIIDNSIRICKAPTSWLFYVALFTVHSPPFISLFHIAIQHSSWFFYRSFHAQHQYPQQSLFLNLSLGVSDPLGLDYPCSCHLLSIPQTSWPSFSVQWFPSVKFKPSHLFNLFPCRFHRSHTAHMRIDRLRRAPGYHNQKSQPNVPPNFLMMWKHISSPTLIFLHALYSLCASSTLTSIHCFNAVKSFYFRKYNSTQSG